MSDQQKSQVLETIRHAKSSHMKWRAYAQALVAGVAVKEENAPVKHTECKFGQWYFGEGWKRFGGLSIYKDIQGAHEMLHHVYEQIYSLVRARKVTTAAEKLPDLMNISRSLLEQLSLLEDDIRARL